MVTYFFMRSWTVKLTVVGAGRAEGAWTCTLFLRGCTELLQTVSQCCCLQCLGRLSHDLGSCISPRLIICELPLELHLQHMSEMLQKMQTLSLPSINSSQ